MVEIEIDDTITSMAHRIAEKRHDSFDHDGYKTDSLPRVSYDRHFIGGLTEVAVSDYYNILVDMEVRRTGDKHDFEIKYNGESATLDIKATTYRPPWLQVKEWKTDSDYYIATYLSGIDADSVELIGWASREQVLSADFISSPGGGDFRNYRLWKDEMEPVPRPEELSKLSQTASINCVSD